MTFHKRINFINILYKDIHGRQRAAPLGSLKNKNHMIKDKFF
jgi:hypothetical protein